MQGALSTLGQLFRHPLPTLMTVAVIGIALALPSGLYVLTRNLSVLADSWEQTTAVSLFLRTEVDVDQAAELATRLRQRPDLDEVQIIKPDEALAELRSETGFSEAIDQLEVNPLPVVLALQPSVDSAAPGALERLREELANLPQADFARVDTEWIRRFHAIIALAERLALLIGGLLSLAVLLVVGNTIRLEIENRRSEIQVMELVGATAAFIRRPFLYMGAWYGLLGGITAWMLIGLALALLDGPVSRLAALYQSQFPLRGLGGVASLVLLGSSLILGMLGSWLSVGRHLTTCEPE
jgi:cell division transport system permease protein